MDERDLLRITAKVEFHESGCWLWLGAPHVRTGYGYVSIGGRFQLTHRALYAALVETIPEGLVLDHLCRIRTCVNPDHLEPVTRQENQLRATRVRGKPVPLAPGLFVPQARTHCNRGHPWKPENIVVKSDGRSRCRICERAASRRYRARKQMTDAAFRERNRAGCHRWYRETGRWKGNIAPSERTRCPHGHVYDDDNTYVDPSGWRHCRTCRREREAERVKSLRAGTP